MASFSNDEYIFYEGDSVGEDLVKKYNLYKYLNYDGNRWLINFVGVVITNYVKVWGFPKHYAIVNDDDKELIVRTVWKSKPVLNEGGERTSEDVPINSYLNVLRYFTEFGLYKIDTKEYQMDYSGNVDWTRTVKNGVKVFVDGQLLFVPMIVRKKGVNYDLITEAMAYVLNEGYRKFGQLLGQGLIVDFSVNVNKFDDVSTIVAALKELQVHLFKDSQKILINNIIEFLLWRGGESGEVAFLTRNFELVWEEIILANLNSHFGYFQNFMPMQYKGDTLDVPFKKRKQKIESSRFIAEYDHLAWSNKFIYLFDSKYYNYTGRINGFNYKQFVYNIVINSDKTFLDGTIASDTQYVFNALVLPTENDTFVEQHIRFEEANIPTVEILEFYVNTRLMLQNYLEG